MIRPLDPRHPGRDDHHQRAADANEEVGPKPRLPAADLALDPHEPASDRREDQLDDRLRRPAERVDEVVKRLVEVLQVSQWSVVRSQQRPNASHYLPHLPTTRQHADVRRDTISDS